MGSEMCIRDRSTSARAQSPCPLRRRAPCGCCVRHEARPGISITLGTESAKDAHSCRLDERLLRRHRVERELLNLRLCQLPALANRTPAVALCMSTSPVSTRVSARTEDDEEDETTHPERPARLDHVQLGHALALALDDRVGPVDRDGRVPPGEDGRQAERAHRRVERVGLEVEGEALGEDLRRRGGWQVLAARSQLAEFLIALSCEGPSKGAKGDAPWWGCACGSCPGTTRTRPAPAPPDAVRPPTIPLLPVIPQRGKGR